MKSVRSELSCIMWMNRQSCFMWMGRQTYRNICFSQFCKCAYKQSTVSLFLKAKHELFWEYESLCLPALHYSICMGIILQAWGVICIRLKGAQFPEGINFRMRLVLLLCQLLWHQSHIHFAKTLCQDSWQTLFLTLHSSANVCFIHLKNVMQKLMKAVSDFSRVRDGRLANVT
jgi:hypothetical protein